MMVRDVSTGRLLARVMVRVPVVAPVAKGTVMSGGCQGVAVTVPTVTVVWADPFIAVQVAGAVTAPQTHPHMGTVLPSGRVVV